MDHDARRFLDAHFPGLTWPAALTPLLRSRRVARGAVIVPQGASGHPLYGVLSGALEIRLLAADGGVSVIEHVGPGQLFGLTSLATGAPSSYEAVAAAPTRLLCIDAAAYTLLMDSVPGFGRALLREFARRHDGTVQQLAAARLQGGMERLTLALAQLRREQAPAPDGRGAVPLRTTQQALAELAGLSRQRVNTLLSQLESQGRVQRRYGTLWLLPD